MRTGGGAAGGAGSTAGSPGGRSVLTLSGAMAQALRSSRVNAVIPVFRIHCKGEFFLKAFVATMFNEKISAIL
jgi:hypothetical protein